MYLEIHHNTSEPLTDQDRAVLQALLDGTSTPAPAPAKASTAKATPTASKAVETPAEAPEPEPEADEAPAGATLEEAVALATKMVSNGEAAKVKKALGTVGAKKVSEIPEDKVDEFVAALS